MENFAKGVSAKLCSAAEEGNVSEVKKYLSMGANVLARNSQHTILHAAVRSDNKEVVKLILDKIEETQGSVCPYIDAKDIEGETPLLWTAKYNFVNAAKILLENGANIDTKSRSDMTALHFSAKNNHKELVKLLICKGANTNIKDINGRKPSDVAREEGHIEIPGYIAFSVSEMFRKQGRYNEALKAYQEALGIQEVDLGPDHPDVLMTRHNMAVVLANQSKHTEALEIYQKIYDIQKRSDILGPEHPYTLMTLYNMAVAFSDKGDISEVFRVFREVLNIKVHKLDSDRPIPLTCCDIEIIENTKSNIESILSEGGEGKHDTYRDIANEEKQTEFKDKLGEVREKFGESRVSSDTKDHQEDVDSHEECLKCKCDELDTIKEVTREHIEDRISDVYIVRGKDRGREAWHDVLIDQSKKEKFLEDSKKGSLDVADYGQVLFSGFGENPPENIKDKVNEFFNTKVGKDLFVIKEVCENVSVYHYILIDPDKRKMFLEQSNTGLSLVRKIENYGNVLYSGWGQDPPEIISNRIIETHFSTSKNISSRDENGWTSLHDAAYFGDLQVVKNLIDSGADILVKDKICGRMPAHIATREGHKDVVEFFLNININVNVADENNWTLLHYAAFSGHLKTVMFLINQGADIEAKEATRSKKPIHVAAERGYMSIVNLLLRNGGGIDDADKDGRTSLYYAAWRGHLEVVKSLADRGANIHAANIYGSKPIYVATFGGSKNVIEFLIDRGANVNDSTNDNFTPLHNAASQGNLKIVEFLIKKGANIDVRSNNDKTPLDSAKAYGHKEVVDFLNGLK